mmetsp:Transcript_13523/g.29296  ORF Transcript_13523/g.29296 Transcript_13523/m.29296 type:complete len:203 (-) Transcript_13523:685-1293(-)
MRTDLGLAEVFEPEAAVAAQAVVQKDFREGKGVDRAVGRADCIPDVQGLPAQHCEELVAAGLHALQSVVQGEHQQRVDPAHALDGETALLLAGRLHGHTLLADPQDLLAQPHRLQVPQVGPGAEQGGDNLPEHHPEKQHLDAGGVHPAQVAADPQEPPVEQRAQPVQELQVRPAQRECPERADPVALEGGCAPQAVQERGPV